jgi:predicted dehydrogenase
MSTRLHRRRFLQATAAGSLGYFFTAPSFSAGRAFGANEKVNFAGIGTGGKGQSDISQAGGLGDVIALCDCDETKRGLGWAAEKWNTAKTFTDYRKLFDDKEIMKAVDAFTISTPDHNHALPAALAMKAGKNVYVQKPLTRTVFEAHLLMKLAREHKVCTQMGNQGTAENGLRKAVELVQSGELGAVKEVHVWTNRPIWPQAPGVTKPPEKKGDVPATLNWEAFLGPAPMRPYAVQVNKRNNQEESPYHPFAWRGWWDFGTGAIGDMACHTANMAFMALKLGMPEYVSAEAGDVNPETCPSYAHVVLKFPARGDLPPVTLNWYEGKKDGKKLTPPDDLVAKAVPLDTIPRHRGKLVDSGSILVGEKGIAYSPDDYGAEVFFSTGAKTNSGTKPEKLPINGGGDGGQKKEWVAAIKAGKPELALSNFDYASMLAGAFVLGNVAIRTKKGFAFDAHTLSAKGCPEAAQYITPHYRKGWDLLKETA